MKLDEDSTFDPPTFSALLGAGEVDGSYEAQDAIDVVACLCIEGPLELSIVAFDLFSFTDVPIDHERLREAPQTLVASTREDDGGWLWDRGWWTGEQGQDAIVLLIARLAVAHVDVDVKKVRRGDVRFLCNLLRKLGHRSVYAPVDVPPCMILHELLHGPRSLREEGRRLDLWAIDLDRGEAPRAFWIGPREEIDGGFWIMLEIFYSGGCSRWL